MEQSDDKTQNTVSDQEWNDVFSRIENIAQRFQLVESKMEEITENLQKVHSSTTTSHRTKVTSFQVVSSSAESKELNKSIFQLNGIRWSIENQDKKEFTLEKALSKHAIYIFNCTDCLIEIPDKINAVTLDKCSKVTLITNRVITSCEILNSKEIIFHSSSIPSLIVDNSTNCELKLKEEALKAEIITSRISNITLFIPDPQQGWKEHHLVERIKTTIQKDTSLNSEAFI